ncbi:PP2C family protein-serine/threonine phosphatase [Fructobacillus parabroussonetiae]|uniref:Serine/threonine-protein phosphatase n=1 Tax=Fructobacillus parabroussonetiae TaxID=2713174 RepID=A0ABS5QYC5_9LACO|nr:protein phosphatase 2C domain-containing protein [Fructobacillus parabroussonetiae]MBS9337625.1 serine/threonine-protein phosphatase [Fructobacillus parabroussonetiae]MCK8617262.1 protein phosphatase 2C domain-containing protein [Fructobacillus parabroussonetiae]
MAIAYQSDKGPARSDNQDAVGAFYNRAGNPLVLVADGVASQEGSKKAARMVVETLGHAWEQVAYDEEEKVKAWLVHQADLANQSILLVGQHDQEVSQMATTLVLAVCLSDKVLVANAGDSRAYLLRQQQAEMLTFDHTVRNELARQAGEPIDEDIPEADSLTRYLGVNKKVDLEWTTFVPDESDWLYLTSDGLAKVLSIDEQVAILQPGVRRPGNNPQMGSVLDISERLSALVKAAIARDVPDNVTALLMTNMTDQMGSTGQRLTVQNDRPVKADELVEENRLKGRLD